MKMDREDVIDATPSQPVARSHSLIAITVRNSKDIPGKRNRPIGPDCL
jgi:hypothetical protein